MRAPATRIGIVVLLGALVVVAGAGPASAHAVGGGPGASNYRTNVLAVTPPVPGLVVRTTGAGDQLELVNRSGQEVIVLGYENEPYLRVRPDGVEENQRSPATFSNRSTVAPSRVPPEFDANAEPQWRRLSSRPVAVWHDHRSHWSEPSDPPAVRQARDRRQVVVPNWQVPLKVGDRTVVASGEIVWVPGPSPWPWLAAVALLFVAVLIGAQRRGRWQVPVLIGATALTVVADAIHTAGNWIGSAAGVAALLYGSSTSFAGWVMAGLAIHRLLTGRPDTGRTFMLLAAILLALAGALPDLPELWRSQLPTQVDPTLTRAAIAATLGLGLGLALVALLGSRGHGRLAPAGGGRPRGGSAASRRAPGPGQGRGGAGAGPGGRRSRGGAQVNVHGKRGNRRR